MGIANENVFAWNKARPWKFPWGLFTETAIKYRVVCAMILWFSIFCNVLTWAAFFLDATWDVPF